MIPEEFAEIAGSLNRFLKVRQRSCGEVARKLREKGYGEESIQGVVQYLNQANLLDDERLVRERLEWRMAEGYGPLHLEREFQNMEIPEEIYREPLLEKIGQLVESAINLYSLEGERPVDPARYRREYGRLIRRGFTEEQVEKILGPGFEPETPFH